MCASIRILPTFRCKSDGIHTALKFSSPCFLIYFSVCPYSTSYLNNICPFALNCLYCTTFHYYFITFNFSFWLFLFLYFSYFPFSLSFLLFISYSFCYSFSSTTTLHLPSFPSSHIHSVILSYLPCSCFLISPQVWYGI